MRLVDLDPRWLLKSERRVGFVFKCPHCQKCYLSCFFEPVAHISGDDDDAQYHLFGKALPELTAGELMQTVPCRRDRAWTPTPRPDLATFEHLSVTPSIDASAAGCWHGFVTDGECK